MRTYLRRIKARYYVILTFVIVIYWCNSMCTSGHSNSPIRDREGAAFAGSTTCISCHATIYQSHIHTAHYLDSRPAAKEFIKGSFDSGKNRFIYNKEREVLLEQKGHLFYQTAFINGKEAQRHPFDIVIGSGRKGQTYLYWDRDNLFQLPISYYTALNDWCISPGYPTDAPVFNREVLAFCMECHSTYATIREPNTSGNNTFGSSTSGKDNPRNDNSRNSNSGPGNPNNGNAGSSVTPNGTSRNSVSGSSAFPNANSGNSASPNATSDDNSSGQDFSNRNDRFDQNQIIYGIDCERCHGPAAEHVAFHTAHPEEKSAHYIVNTRRLSRQQRLDACALCHSGGRAQLLPAFSFKAGDTLNKYSLAKYASTDEATLDVHGNQYGLLSSSKCFISSQMDCSSCHNVHVNEANNPKLFSERCMTCHDGTTHPGCKMTPTPGFVLSNNCIDCHMPLLPSQKILLTLSNSSQPIHNLVRTHRIAIYPESTKEYLRNIKAQ